MSSSSPPSTSPAQQALSTPSRLRDADKYRQTVYRDGAGCRIAESRRRSRMGRVAQSATSTHLDWILYPANDSYTSSKSQQAYALQQDPSSGSCSRSPGLVTHVTSAKRRSTPIKSKAVVVIETRQPVVTSLKKIGPSVQMLRELTPPPTPRLERLSTPDLSDLDELPFCDCGVEAHLIKLCTLCNKEVSLCKV